jgi:hypothetical protein
MKKVLPLIMILMTAPLAARADLQHRMTSSAALTVDAATTSVTRAGNTFSLSGNNVTTTVTPSGGSAAASLGGMAVNASTGVATFTIPDATQTTAGDAFSYTVTTTQGDALGSSAPSIGAVHNFSNQYSTAAGTAGSAAGGAHSAHGFDSVAAGGAGSTVTTQFVTELTVR